MEQQLLYNQNLLEISKRKKSVSSLFNEKTQKQQTRSKKNGPNNVRDSPKDARQPKSHDVGSTRNDDGNTSCKDER